jgi:hypothetical protein
MNFRAHGLNYTAVVPNFNNLFVGDYILSCLLVLEILLHDLYPKLGFDLPFALLYDFVYWNLVLIKMCAAVDVLIFIVHIT